MKSLNDLIKAVAIGVAIAAVVQELKKPPAEREWHGKVLGFVPYDFRIPTSQRFMDAYWNPEEPTIFTDRVLGVGWAINLGRLYKMFKERRQRIYNG